MAFYLDLVSRLILACVLGGIIGYEREYTNRPAGFRTHILVCVGSALVMITSEFIFVKYTGQTNADPARLGAQVISGIGFLGAGTIIREGFNVKGLTTAASLWAVSCVGIAVGIGFYSGAIAATVLIFLTLITLKRIERHFARKNRYRTVYIKAENVSGRIGEISSVFYKQGIRIRNIEFSGEEDGSIMLVKFLVRLPNCVIPDFMEGIRSIDGILKVYEE
jgi:putative Mg2+ transporter-C (MgtC) family protein